MVRELDRLLLTRITMRRRLERLVLAVLFAPLDLLMAPLAQPRVLDALYHLGLFAVLVVLEGERVLVNWRTARWGA